MENEKVFYSVSDLAANLNVPRTTVNDWLKKFDRYIDFEIRGRRKVYTADSLRVLKIICDARDKGTAISDLESELASSCAVRPEISPLSADTPDNSADPEKENSKDAEENLPAVQFDVNAFIRELEQRGSGQERRSKRGFLLVSVLLILLLAAACATLLLLGQLLTLKESSKTLDARLSASREETVLMRKNAENEFKKIAEKVENAGRSGTAAVEMLQKRLTEQRRQFSGILIRLEKAEKLREQEITRLEKENLRLKTELAAAAKMLLKMQKSLDAEEKNKKQLEKQIKLLEKQVVSLKQKTSTVPENKSVKMRTAETVKTVKSGEKKK